MLGFAALTPTYRLTAKQGREWHGANAAKDTEGNSP